MAVTWKKGLVLTADGASPGEFLRHLREYRGWTRTELAEKTRYQVKERSIYNYENDLTKPQASSLLPLARVFGGSDGVQLLERFGFDTDARMLEQRFERERQENPDEELSRLVELLLTEFRRSKEPLT